MRKRAPNADDDSTAKIIGGALGVIVGAVLLWFFFTYGIAALLGR